MFDYERVLSLSLAELTLLKNAQQVYLATAGKRKKGVQLSWVYIKDHEGWGKSFGKATFNDVLFVLPKTKRVKKTDIV